MVFMFMSFIIFLNGMNMLMCNFMIIMELNMFNMNSCSISMVILLDWISLLFMSFVLFISSLIINYSNEYMNNEKNLNLFIFLVILFVISMMLLIISPNLISILLGWDGLGLISYLLVIYYQNLKSFNAGMLTVLMNRVGDVMILISIAWFMNYGSWNFIFYVNYLNDSIIQFISYMIIIGAFTKSAQIPFSAWLPAAMAAPTPVSSLVHSSTLVTAGVYLLIRFNFMFEYLNMNLFIFLSLMTMFMAGMGANFEFDLKKIIALSTLSQLGLMMVILFIGSWELAYFHLLIHALFKALLFMCAGMFIHSMNDYQDIRFMGQLIYSMPLSSLIFNISNLSLCGLPFLSGFYSKDLIMEMMSMNSVNMLIYLIMYISIGLTVSYSFRLTFYLMMNKYMFNSLNNKFENLDYMMKSMLLMLIFVIFSGSLFSWMMFSFPYFICLSMFMKMLTLMFIIIGMYLGIELSKFNVNYNNWSLNNIYTSFFFGNMWNLFYMSIFMNKKILFLGKKYFKIMDHGWLEYMGSQNLNKNMIYSSKILQKLFNNYIKIYFLLMVLWILILFLMI
uniref:NADH-ubiquinone oxidoreductase chain 5 n=1 Tax=Discolomatidae sp. 3 ACP-2013 TaxID=1434486 RepID=A0A3G3FXI3_9CUCU|nr:NADH dehydrogenase subunit 5 [Discolomatidae sp. 3 ACP-2013]